MRLHLDSSACEGHGLCYTRTDLFESDDDGYAVLLADGDLAEDQIELARIAQRSCPERAIDLTDD